MEQHLPDREKLNRFLNGELPEGEKLDQSDLNQLLEASSRLDIPVGRSQKEAWEELQSRISIDRTSAPPKVRSLYNRVTFLAVAAVLAILLSTYFVFRTQTTTINSLRAEQIAYELPDGSEIKLNADSEISFEKANWDINDRILSLKGEAFFEVNKGKPFIVRTEMGMVEVLGTSFNVYTRPEGMEVSCFTGSVEVTTPTQKKIVLKKGKALRYLKGESHQVFDFDQIITGGWQKGDFTFDNAPINHVIAVIERQFDVQIEGPDLSDRRYTGGFNNQNLKEALRLVFKPMNLNYDLVNSQHIRLSEAAIND